jgi:hypothetical protein
MLRTLWDHLAHLEKTIKAMDERIEEQMRPFEAEIKRLDGIPGVDRVVAQALIAEVGADMTRFPTADHLASWAGLCPGNNESAGKRKSGRTPKANRWLKRCLSQAAWAASHTKDTYLSAQFRQIAKRRGKKRAIIAVAHTILIATYYILQGAEYRELGGDYFDRLHPERLQAYYVPRLEQLGFDVWLSESPIGHGVNADNIAECLRILKQAKWDGFLSVECLGTDENLASSLDWLRKQLAA